MIKKISAGLLLGIWLTAFVLQEDPWVKAHVGSWYKRTVGTALNCVMEGEVERLSFMPLSLTLKNVHVTPPHHAPAAWHWRCARYATGGSYFSFLRFGMAALWITVEEPVITSALSGGTLAIEPHIRTLLQPAALDVPVYLDTVVLKNGTLTVHDPATATKLFLNASYDVRLVRNALKSTLFLHDGYAIWQGHELFSALGGTLNLTFAAHTTVAADCRLVVPQLEGYRAGCSLRGMWESGSGTFVFKNASESLVIDPITVARAGDSFKVALRGKVPCSYIGRFFCNERQASLMQGDLLLDAAGEVSPYDRFWQVNSASDDLLYDGSTLGTIGALSVSGNAAGSKASWLWQTPCGPHRGVFSWDSSAGAGVLQVETALHQLPKNSFLSAFPRTITAEFCSTNDGIAGTYAAHTADAPGVRAVALQGEFVAQQQELTTTGTINEKQYQLTCSKEGSWVLERFKYCAPSGKELITLARNNKAFDAHIHFPLVRALVRSTCNYDVQGEGVVALNLQATEAGYKGLISLHEGAIRLPETYNFITNLSAGVTVNTFNSLVTLEDVACTLHKGSVHCNRATLFFDPSYQLSFAYVPLLFDNCLLNVRRDLFALVSGNLAYTHEHKSMPQLKGQLVLEQAQFSESLFSEKLHKELFLATDAQSGTFDSACDVTVTSRYPARVTTSLIEAQTKINLHVRGTVRKPEISGALELVSGTLAFPYKPLHITKGHVYFLPSQQLDPMIEMTAKNKIKKHHVTMQVSGSLKNHQVTFESMPALTEEQIASLLFSGSYGASLNIAAPALIMKQLQGALFNSEESAERLALYRSKVPDTFKNISLVPSFVEKNGKIGLRGALEIDLSDRWRALVQKDLTEVDDARFEVEYLLSDDISLRAVRDERSEVSGEVEVRWKFGRS